MEECKHEWAEWRGMTICELCGELDRPQKDDV